MLERSLLLCGVDISIDCVFILTLLTMVILERIVLDVSPRLPS